LAAALTLAVLAASLALAPSAAASPTPAPGTTLYGNDISWPECSRVGYGSPGPTPRAKFAVLGLTDGGSFRVNPCLARQVAMVKARHLWVSAYAISTYPTRAQLARYGGTGSLGLRLRRAGAAQARFNVASMARAGLRPRMVWVDIEPRARAPWSASSASNNAVIDGVLAGYKARGLRTGLYSYAAAWSSITGSRAMPGVPTWVPVGSKGIRVAARRCAVASFSGSKPWLTQWVDVPDVLDHNITCPVVTGKAARGNLLTPYLNVRLAVGSRGGAVTVLQRRLGGLKADGVFGPQTKTRVVAFQHARRLRANGIVATAVWRALGAGTGTYIPPVRGTMGALFAST
jgi:peptidoglycan hydrolase-like protein with peptidoglycan-binding domain